MKPFLNALLLLLFSFGSLTADDRKQTSVMVKWALIGADQVRIEAEAESIVEIGSLVVPLSPSANKYLLCSARINPGDRTAEFSVMKPSPPMGLSKEDGGKPVIELFRVARVFRSGEEMVLLKSTGFSIAVTVTLPAEDEPGKDQAAEVKPEPDPRMLTEEEMGKIVVETEYDPANRRIQISGYNPFEKPLGEGVLRVTVPKTENTPELVRDYRMVLGAQGLADFRAQVQAFLDMPEGVKLLCKLVRLNFQN